MALHLYLLRRSETSVHSLNDLKMNGPNGSSRRDSESRSKRTALGTRVDVFREKARAKKLPKARRLTIAKKAAIASLPCADLEDRITLRPTSTGTFEMWVVRHPSLNALPLDRRLPMPVSVLKRPRRAIAGIALAPSLGAVTASVKSEPSAPFDAQAFLTSAGFAKRVMTFPRNAVIFSQGDACESVMYIKTGGVKLSVLSHTGREAVIAMLGQGEFFGESCLAGHAVRMGSATAIADSTVILVDKQEMVRLLHKQPALSDRFIAHLLARNIRVEEDLVDQLFNSSEKRLARTLLLLARYGKHDKPVRAVLPISQETLAEIVGTTRSRINFFMKKFQRLGFIDYKKLRVKVNNSLLTVVLHD